MNLQWVCENATNARYLTQAELDRLADHFKFWGELSLAQLMMGEHAPANGRCFEVLLTDREALQVDRACEALEFSF